MVPPSSFFISFGIPICFHILFFKILFSEFFVVLFRCFFVSFIFRFSTTNRCLSMAQCTQYKKKDTLRKARPSPRVEKVTFSSTLREGQVVATRCSMSVTFPLLRLQPTTPGTLWIVSISGGSRPPVLSPPVKVWLLAPGDGRSVGRSRCEVPVGDPTSAQESGGGRPRAEVYVHLFRLYSPM